MRPDYDDGGNPSTYACAIPALAPLLNNLLA
jgi:hypothetical protein